ncbi:hypothetical protein YB2330_003204 [Saitoella coloradoensis]
MRFSAFVAFGIGVSSTIAAAVQARDDVHTSPYSPDLNPNIFDETIKDGTYFIKAYSPQCSHCRDLAPTWNAVAEQFKDLEGFHFASLNCAAYGDLCSKIGVTAYPSMRLFKKGEQIEEYPMYASRTEREISKYVKANAGVSQKTPEQVKEEAPKVDVEKATEVVTPTNAEAEKKLNAEAPKALTNVNAHGIATELTQETFHSLVSTTNDPWFIKFYTPWCHFCQQMAPAWTELAKEMRGKLRTGSVNCEAEPRLCKDLGLRGYPTLMFFRGGEKVEYEGLRGLGDLLAFSNMAVEAGAHEVDAAGFEKYAEKNEVTFIYFYDDATTSEDFAALERTSLPLIGHAPLLKTKSDILAARFRVNAFPKLIAVRDGKPNYYTALGPRDMRDYRRIISWMQSVWLPVLPELSAANAHEIITSEKTVVLAILDPQAEDFDAVRKEMKDAALAFADARAEDEKAEKMRQRKEKQDKIDEAERDGDKGAVDRAKGIQVVVPEPKKVGFAWVDGVFWEKWIAGTYGIDVHETGHRVIINEQDEKRFWDITKVGQPIPPAKALVLDTLNAVLKNPRSIHFKSTKTRFESAVSAAKELGEAHRHSLAGFGVFLLVLGAVWWFVKRKGTGAFNRRKGGILDGVGLKDVESRAGTAASNGKGTGKFD